MPRRLQGVSSYPTIKFFDGGENVEFEGDRSSGSFVNFVDSKVSDDEFMATAEFQKLPTKILKKILKERGEKCNGCTERHEFIALAEKIRNKPKLEKKKKPKTSSLVNGMTFAQERRHKEALAVAKEVCIVYNL